ncbi:MAG TPA: aminotransferase class V-fold PLP-dependent enzyme [Anaerolineae bacterium]|nr:aminotransferase class V-fold PLP-dependent enzyme [Anaerolineae bacterium]HQI83770.1 aminotransferase class V-fold PLP-dependent enzyme [Anaerolineae bacterium]
MDIYDELGVTKVINGAATLTRFGGSLMPPEVLAAMAEAAQHFVDIDELQQKVGARIAAWTHNEAAYVACGAAAGMVLSTAACITGLDPEKRARLPYTDGMKNEIIIHKCWRVGYDFAIQQAGGKLVEIGTEHSATADDMERAINEKTAAIFYFYNVSQMGGYVPLEQGIAVAQRHGIPLIVDAAAQIPPVENLWRFTQMGADLVLFSGGKGLCGPQSSGLILGRKDLIEACAFNACPRAFIGRPMKVGKEELVGLMAAVRWYLDLDHAALMQSYEDQVQAVINAFADHPHATARRSFPSEAGQPMPRAEIILDEAAIGMTRDEVLRQLRGGEPSIVLAEAGANGLFVNPQTLRAGEVQIIINRVQQIIA